MTKQFINNSMGRFADYVLDQYSKDEQRLILKEACESPRPANREYGEVNMQKKNFDNAYWRNYNLRNRQFKNCSFVEAVLSYTEFDGLIFRKCNLRETNFTCAYIANTDFVKSELQNANFHCATFSNVFFIGCDLRRVSFSSVPMDKVSFKDCNLEGANFQDALLFGCSFGGSRMRGTKFSISVPKIDNIHQTLADLVGTNWSSLHNGNWKKAIKTGYSLTDFIFMITGEAGKLLKAYLGPDAAAALIYQASDPGLERIPSSFELSPSAIEDIQKRASRRCK